MTDRRILYATAFLRALATGMIGVLLGIYLAKLDFDAAAIGAFIGLGLIGCAAAALVATIAGDRIGRRRMLIGLAALGTAGGLALSLSSSGWAIAAALFLGMVNGMGRDRGAALVLEQAILPSTATASDRTRAIAWYSLLQDVGHALGSLLAGLPVAIRMLAGGAGGTAATGTSASAAVATATATAATAATEAAAVSGAGLPDQLPALRIAVGCYALLVLVTCLLSTRLSPAIEAPATARGGLFANRLSPESRRILLRISALFALDGLGGGFLTTALLSFFFYERFGAGEGTVSVLFFFARILNAVSHLGAAWLSKRIGLVNTMVFTHIPSSILLLTVPFAPSFAVAAVLFLIREGLVEMDVPTRQSYVFAVVRPEERTVASGVTSLVRLAAWAVAPAFAGLFMIGSTAGLAGGAGLGLPLAIGAGMKIVYDILLWSAFRRLKPPEEGVS